MSTDAQKTIITYVLLSFLLLGILSSGNPLGRKHFVDVPYSEFKQLVRSGKAQSVRFAGDEITAELEAEVELPFTKQVTKFVKTHTPLLGDEELLTLLEANQVVINVASNQKQRSIVSTLIGLLPFILILGFYLWVLRRMGSGFGQENRINSFLNPNAEVEDTPPSTSFDDVAGQENAKQEVSELLDYIRQPEQYTALGATVPKGVLLMGPPGTGKTLLARALAGEAGVPFCSISASEFIELYVGVGAARVRALFKQAKEKAPSIIFIDELDAVGRARGTGLGGGNDEREQTLNQILSEMDGFTDHEAVIVLAATNRPDVLDPALLRPGRFDRHVTLELPDIAAREAILKVHTRDTPLSDSVDLQHVAAETPGFSGADLKNLVNEAAMHAARNNASEITSSDFEQMREKVVFGSTRKITIGPEEKHRLAAHEAGHTATAFYLPNADPIHKVTIIPRGNALGATQQLPENERYTLPQPYLNSRLIVMLAGRAAEKIFLGSVSSGADDDISQATSLARAMVTRWGMSPEIGPIDLRESDDHPFLGRSISKPRSHSEASAHTVDQAVQTLLINAEAEATKLLVAHQTEVQNLIDSLKRHETLNRQAIIDILSANKTKQIEAHALAKQCAH